MAKLSPLSILQATLLLPKCGLGIALYSGECEWNYYGDSKKAREYLAAGLPVLINNVPSTADDIKKENVGIVFEELNAEELYRAIEKIFSNADYYNELRNNAINLAQKTDIFKILEQRLNTD